MEVDDVESFDVLFSSVEKKRLLEVIERSEDLENDLNEILSGWKMHFMRHMVNNRMIFKYFLMYQLYPGDRKRIKRLLRNEDGCDVFVRYLENDMMSMMRGSKVIDFDKMDVYDSVDVVKNEYPPGSKISYESGVEIVHIPGRKKCVEYDGSVPENVRNLFGDEFRFNYVQSVVNDRILNSDENVLVCAPTGSGKTVIGALGILREIEKGGRVRIAYVAPMKALVDELHKIFVGLFSRYGMKVMKQTSDVHFSYSEIEKMDILVCTPEKLDILSRNMNLDIDLLVIDEIHVLNDSRGATIEALVGRVMMSGDSRVIGLSASLPNYIDIGMFIGCKNENVFYFEPELRRTVIDYELINVGSKDREMMMVVEKVMENIEESGSVFVFVHSRNDSVIVGKEIMRHMDKIDEIEMVRNGEVNELLRYGVGIHHAGLDKDTRRIVEDLYRNGKINVMVCTATLAWGVNLPGRTVIIKGTEIYNRERCEWMRLRQADMIQMFGRAGRFGEARCKGVLISSNENEFLIEKSVDSRLLPHICDCLNAEISRGMSSFEEAMDWFKYTFYYIRLLRVNPEPGKIIKEIIYSALKHLEESGLIRLSPMIHPTHLGRLASRYYIHYRDIQRLFTVTGHSDSSLFSILDDVREFRNLNVDEDEMKTLKDMVPIPTESGFGIVLQCYIGNRMESSVISQNGPRILSALFEIAVIKRLGFSKMILGWSKGAIHRIFPYQTPLRHFINDKNLLNQLEMKEIPFGVLETLNEDDFNEIGISGRCVIENMKYIPRFSIVPDIYMSKSGYHIINIDVEKMFDDSKMESDVYYLFITDSRDESMIIFDILSIGKRSRYMNQYYGITTNSPFLNIYILSSNYLCHVGPVVLDLRGINDSIISIFSDIWRDWIMGVRDMSITVRPGLFHDEITTDVVVVSNESERRRLRFLGYESYTYDEFVSKRLIPESVTIMDVHNITSDHLVEVCIAHCVVNHIKMNLDGLPFTESDIEGVSDEVRDIKVYGSSGLSYYTRLNDYRVEMVLNIKEIDLDEDVCLVVCPTMKTIMYFMRIFKEGKVAMEDVVMKSGLYFVSKNTIDLWIKRRLKLSVDQIHVIETSYYDHELSLYVEYSMADVKRYSLLSSSVFLYLRQSKMNLYFNNGVIPLYYTSSNRKEIHVYSHWLGCSSGMSVDLPLLIDDGLTEYGMIMCRYGVSINTMEMFVPIKDGMGLKNILSLLCSTDELSFDINSDDVELLNGFKIDLSRGKAHGLTSYMLSHNERNRMIVEMYIYDILPMIRRLYLCLLEISMIKSHLKTSFNIMFGLQEIMRCFIDVETRFYDVHLVDGMIEICVSSVPDVRQEIVFFISSEGGESRILHVDKPGMYPIDLKSTTCYVLSDSHSGFESVE